MRILAVDTSTTSCSVAVADKDSLLAEATIIREQTHSKHLMDMVDRVVSFSGMAISELDGFAVTRGPGTFTGLRIGISTVKKIVGEGVLPPEEAVSDINEPSLFVGNGAKLYQDIIAQKVGEQAYFALPWQNTIRASTVAQLSIGRFEKKDTDDVAILVPQYIRESDAELNFNKNNSPKVQDV